jgi:hypothetical protein
MKLYYKISRYSFFHSAFSVLAMTALLSNSPCWAGYAQEPQKEVQSETSYLTPKTTQYYLGVGQDALLGFTGYGGVRFMLTPTSGLNIHGVLYSSPNLAGITVYPGNIAYSGPTPTSLEVAYDHLFLDNSLYLSLGLIESNGNFLASAGFGPGRILDSIGPTFVAIYGKQYFEGELRFTYYHSIRKNTPNYGYRNFLKYILYAGFKPIPIMSIGPFLGVYRSFEYNPDGGIRNFYDFASRIGGRIKLVIPNGIWLDISAGIDSSITAKSLSLDQNSIGEWYTMTFVVPFTI